MLAATNLAPVIGVDIHFVTPPPHPMPHPFTGLVLDPIDFIPIIGGTVIVNGIPRAQAGSTGFALPPHKPIGGAFVKEPDNDCTVFMGSATVIADGEPFSYMALPVLSCQQVGIPSPPRKKPHKQESCYLPTSIVLPIPFGPPVMVGGPPIIAMDVMASTLGMAALGRGLKKLASKLKQVLKDAAEERPWLKRMLGCEGLGLIGHPVNVVTGANVDTFEDAVIDGPLPIQWSRRYSSLGCGREGPMGRGFRHEYERELRRRPDGGLTFVDADGTMLEFPPPAGERLEVVENGYKLRALGRGRFEVRRADRRMELALPDDAERGPMVRLAVGENALELDYDEAGHVVAIWRADGTRLCLLHDEAGHVVRVVLRDLAAAGEEETVASYAYDAEGRLVRWTDARGNAAHYDYDPAHRLVRATDRRGYAFFFRYDAEGRCVESSGEDGLLHVRLEYLPAERRTVVTHGDGGRWEYSYDARGTLTRIVDPYGGARVLRQDESGRIVEDVDPNGNVTRLLYDEDGRHYARVDPLGYTVPTYDKEPHPRNPLAYELPDTPLEWEHGRLLDRTQIRTPDDESLEQDASGEADGERDPGENLVSLRDRDGLTRSFTYASWNLPSREIDGEGHATAYSYTVRAKVTKVVGPTGTVVEYLYDHKDRIREVKLRGRVFEQYAYDAADNLIEKRDAEGRVLLSLSAGAGNALATRRLGSGETQRFERDARGRITAASTERMRATFERDAAGRVLRDERDGMGVRHVLEEGTLHETVYFDRFRVAYRREGGGLTITDPTGNEHRLYVGADGVMVRRLSNGAREILSYDGAGRCQIKIWEGVGGAAAWVRRYRYSNEGNLLALDDSQAGTMAYDYDAAHRLLRRRRPDGGNDAFEYDAAGNLVSQPGLSGAVIAEGNLMVAAKGHRFAYNGRDRLARWEGPRGGVKTFEYDELDRLVRATIDGEPWAAAYDPLYRRVEKTWRGQTSRYYWDHFRPAAEVRGDGSLRLYVYEDHVALSPFLLVEYTSVDAAAETGRAHFIATDHLGVPVRVEEMTGAVVWAGAVDPFGVVHVERATIDMPLRFPGHWHDAETGLHFNRFRYYSPELGRYLEPDPWGTRGGVNLYAYVQEDNPLRAVDIDGLGRGKRCISKVDDDGDDKAEEEVETKAKKPRPSRDEREKNRVIKGFMSKTGEREGTRGNDAMQKKVKAIDGDLKSADAELRANKPPKKLANGKTIFQDSSRGFEKAFSTQWWAEQDDPPECHLCNNDIDDSERSIDHLKPWADQKLEIETQTVCKGGQHWEVALREDALSIIQDEKNLRPAHQSCNSSKSGTKGTDSIAPRLVGDCPDGDDCDLPKAV